MTHQNQKKGKTGIRFGTISGITGLAFSYRSAAKRNEGQSAKAG
jgi:hypothetical protein